MSYILDSFGKVAINTTGKPVKWRMFFFDSDNKKVLECCEYAMTSGEAIDKVLSELKDKKLKKSITAIDSVIE